MTLAFPHIKYREVPGGVTVIFESLQENYRRATDHWAECPLCASAGGDQVDSDDLCITGQELLLMCEQAELNWLVESTDAYAE